MTRGSKLNGWILLAETWAHPQWCPSALSIFLFFSFPFGNVFVYLFDSFHDLECKFTDPRALISTYMKKDSYLRNKMQVIRKTGSKPNSWDLGAHTVAPKCFSALFLFFSSLVRFLCVLVMPFVRFRTRSYRSEGPDINLHEEEPKFERQNARMTKTGLKPNSWDLGATVYAPKCFSALFSFKFGFFSMRMIWMQDLS